MSDKNGFHLADQIEAARKITLWAENLARQLSQMDSTPALVTGPIRIPPQVLVRRYIRHRRAREAAFPAGIFADPAWEILLDLFASELEGKAVSVTDACVASTVPSTTALRWVRKLVDEELVHRSSDQQDGRRVYLTLTARSRDNLSNWVLQALT